MNQTNEGQPELDIKVMLIGDQAVGKSSLMVRYTEDNFYVNMLGTAGLDFKKKIIRRGDKVIKVTVYDTAGHERFRKINKSYYRNVKGMILVYDITDKQTFDNFTEWMNSILENEQKEKSTQILILGNKIDMPEERKVLLEEGNSIASKYNALFTETSAKTGENVENAFNLIIDKIIQTEQAIADNKSKENSNEQNISKTKEVKEDNYQVSKTDPDNNKILITNNNETDKLKLSTEGTQYSSGKKTKKANCFCY